jgi:hypothetical protein
MDDDVDEDNAEDDDEDDGEVEEMTVTLEVGWQCRCRPGTIGGRLWTYNEAGQWHKRKAKK